MTMKRIYRSASYVLGHRCARGHGANRRLAWSPGETYASCAGCGAFLRAADLGFLSRAEAEAAEVAAARPTWPWDSSAAILLAMQDRGGE